MNGGYNILDVSNREIVINSAQTQMGLIQYYEGDRIYNIIDSMLNNGKPWLLKVRTKIFLGEELISDGTAITFMSVVGDGSGMAATARVTLGQLNFNITISKIVEPVNSYGVSVEVTQ